MKITYFAFDIFAPSNTAGFIHTYEIANNISNHADKVTLFAAPPFPNALNPLLWKTTINGLQVEYVRFTLWFKPYLIPVLPVNVLSYYRVLQKVNHIKPDIIHERFHTPNPFGYRIANEVGIPRVLEVNSLYIEDGAYKNPLLKRMAMKDRSKQFEQASALITQTESLKRMLAKLTDKPVYVVPNGVNTTKFRPDIDTSLLKQELGIDPEDVIITFVGSFREWHGVHLIPQIAENIQYDHPEAKFLLIGSGPLFNFIQKIKTPNMLLLGSKDHDAIPAYLALSDILIAPFDISKYPDELGFWWSPMKMFEYMSAGKPVVSFDFEEIRKIVKEGGLLAKPGDVNGFTKKLRYLIENESIRRKLGEKGREIAVRGYDWSIRAKQTVDVYKQIL